MDRTHLNLISAALIAVSLLSTYQPVWSAKSASKSTDKSVLKTDIPSDMVTTSGVTKAMVNPSALHRMDFVVKGTSCPACLLRVQKRLEKSKGVVQAGIMLRKPYGGVCIFDGSKTDKAKLLVLGKGNEANINFDMVEDQAISKMPAVLIPHHAMDMSVKN